MKKSCASVLAEKLSGFVGARLFEQHFQEDIGINEKLHSISLRRREILCCRSTEVCSSRMSRRAPAQANCGFWRLLDRCFASKNSTKSRTSACRSGAKSLSISSIGLMYSFIAVHYNSWWRCLEKIGCP